MSKSIRFLGLAICGWAGVRAVSLGLVPPMSAMAFDLESARRRPSRLPPLQPTALPPIEPVQNPGMRQPHYLASGVAGGFLPFPIYVPAAAPASMQSPPPQIIYINPPRGEARNFHVYGGGDPPTIDGHREAMAVPMPQPRVTPFFTPGNVQGELDRLSLSSWALMRGKGGPDSLSNSGMLGGSEAGARLMWRFDPRIAATLRTSSPINSQRGMEAALGLRYQPFTDMPIALTVERRHGFGSYGSNAFALFAEGGVYGRPIPWHLSLDSYFQAGVVDFSKPDWFFDGQLAVSRPVWGNISAGFGAWGGAQPGLKRLDLGPRMSVKVGSRTQAHLDYRINVAGNARPGSGATLTLAGDF